LLNFPFSCSIPFSFYGNQPPAIESAPHGCCSLPPFASLFARPYDAVGGGKNSASRQSRPAANGTGRFTLAPERRYMEYVAINFREKLAKFSDHWAPKVIAQMNDYQFKLVKIQGEFVWHSHAETDEVFIVLDGEMSIELPHGRVDLKAGDMFVVPKGVEHKPVAENECKILLVEPVGTINTGDAGGEMTAEDNVWI
jgi:mannose-6-phosphate isomerase-like protein (cupin superfamily)